MNLATWYLGAASVSSVLAVANHGAATYYFTALAGLCLLASASARHRGL